MSINWYIAQTTVAYAVPAAALGCLGMSIVRNLRNDVLKASRRFAWLSTAAFVVHPIPLSLTMWLASARHPVVGERFALVGIWASLICIPVALFLNIYFGLRSHSSAGARAALAGIFMIVGIGAGDLVLFFGLFSKVVS